MADFFDNVDWETARLLESLSRLSLELRNARQGVLRHYGVTHEDELLAQVVAGDMPEHPVYEHVLALRVLHDSREAVRRMIAAGGKERGEPLSWHAVLKTYAEAHLADVLDSPATLTQDALALRLANGVSLQVHCAAPDAWSFRWHTADDARQAGIDTAPRHTGMPSHMHRADGGVVTDPFARPGASPEAILHAVVERLRVEPRLGRED